MIKNVLLLGGSGFVGTWIANRLSQMGVRVTIPTRRRERNKANIMLPQVEASKTILLSPTVTTDELSSKEQQLRELAGKLKERQQLLKQH